MIEYYVTVTPLSGIHAFQMWEATVSVGGRPFGDASDIRDALIAATEIAEKQQDAQESV